MTGPAMFLCANTPRQSPACCGSSAVGGVHRHVGQQHQTDIAERHDCQCLRRRAPPRRRRRRAAAPAPRRCSEDADDGEEGGAQRRRRIGRDRDREAKKPSSRSHHGLKRTRRACADRRRQTSASSAERAERAETELVDDVAAACRRRSAPAGWNGRNDIDERRQQHGRDRPSRRRPAGNASASGAALSSFQVADTAHWRIRIRPERGRARHRSDRAPMDSEPVAASLDSGAERRGGEQRQALQQDACAGQAGRPARFFFSTSVEITPLRRLRARIQSASTPPCRHGFVDRRLGAPGRGGSPLSRRG